MNLFLRYSYNLTNDIKYLIEICKIYISGVFNIIQYILCK